MVLNRKRTTYMPIAAFTEDDMIAAVELVCAGRSLRDAAKEKNGHTQHVLLYRLLYCCRYVKKKKENPETDVHMRPKYDCRRVFSDEGEGHLVTYLLECAKMCCGLDTIESSLEYEMAMRNGIEVPENWKNKIWLESIATAFNKRNVGLFFDNLETILKLDPSLSFSDGQNPKNTFAPKGVKQLNKAISGEKGTLVTTCCLWSSIAISHVHFKEHMLKGAPPGTLGLAAQSGWMNSELFAIVTQHFVKVSHSSKENPSLLILDNHESHLSIIGLDIAKYNGVTVLTIPPHCSNRMQPLDISVFGSFQMHYNAAIESWMLHQPGYPLTT
ncbi:hypothetical protein PR048_008477 [Dryococelus australis]|uniref:DDE-1 domain-containing protein n=1 Tax=Dryococelus australis TaxID=614101 RepID=A0ABQ9HYZ1_9NEOP|nr:hypothetical protein PR048_008477 [Dryococelus australis]